MFWIEKNVKLILLFSALFLLAIAALILLLPHSHKPQSKPQGPTTVQTTITNLNGSLSQNQSQPTNQVNNTTTTTTTASAPARNLSAPITTTIVYVYCVGSDVPSFNQSYYAALYPSGIKTWVPTTNYTTSFFGGSCSTYNSNIYCVDGNTGRSSPQTTQVSYAVISASGIGQWSQTTSYPIKFGFGSCAAYNSYIYCVGTADANYSNETYYAPITSSGVGQWSQTTSFPVPFYYAQCTTYNGYIYCMGDPYFNTNTPSNSISANTLSALFPQISYNYYAPISSSGIGQWEKLNSPPLPSATSICQPYASTMYCLIQPLPLLSINTSQITSASQASQVESELSTLNLTAGESTDTAYAHILADGNLGNWNETDSYPGSLQYGSCVAYYGSLYCIGTSPTGQQVLYYSIPSSNGISDWAQTSSYPLSMFEDYCSIGSVSS